MMNCLGPLMTSAAGQTTAAPTAASSSSLSASKITVAPHILSQSTRTNRSNICTMDESPFDNVLRTDDFARAQTLVSIGNFLQTYPPRMTLDQYVAGRRGDEGFSQTLVHLIRHSIYPVTCSFLQHVISHFSLCNVYTILDAVMITGMTGPQGNVIHLAVMRGELDLIKRLVAMGFDLEARDSKNQTPVFYLIQGEDPVVLKAIVPGCDAAANTLPFITDAMSDGGSDSDLPYCMSAEYDRSRIIVVDLQSSYSFDEKVWRYLVKDKSVELNLIDDFGDTPLTLAIKLHRHEVIQQLLTLNRVRVDLMIDNRPPFHVYCEEGILYMNVFNQFIMRLVLLANSNISIRNYEGKTVLHCLLNNQAGIETPAFLIPFIMKLKEKENRLLVMQDAAGETPLMTAVTRGYPFELLQHLIPASSEGVNLVNKLGFNALALSLLQFQGELGTHDQYYPPPMSQAKVNDCEDDRSCKERLRWDLQMHSNRRHSFNRSPQVNRNNSRNSGHQKVTVDDGVGRAEADLHRLIHALTMLKGKLDQGSGLRTSKTTRESILSFVIHNKRITHHTMSLLVQKGLITSVTPRDIQECVIEFRLDLLDELLRFASGTKNALMNQVIKGMEGLAINLLDHVYTFRHIYATVCQRQQSSSCYTDQAGSKNETGVRRGDQSPASACNVRSSNGMKPAIISDHAIPDVSRLLARQNLSRVKDLVSRLFDHFDHDINHVIKQIDPHTKREVECFTLIHALIQANSWIEMPDVVDYILREKGSLLNIDVSLPGRGSPINYAIRLGQFDIADRILDLDPDLSQLNLAIPVLPLKRNFSDVMRRLIKQGIQIPREFGIQNIRSGIDDAKLEVEFFDFLTEARLAQKRSSSTRRHK